jgi:hypothetical protein
VVRRPDGVPDLPASAWVPSGQVAESQVSPVATGVGQRQVSRGPARRWRRRPPADGAARLVEAPQRLGDRQWIVVRKVCLVALALELIPPKRVRGCKRIC